MSQPSTPSSRGANHATRRSRSLLADSACADLAGVGRRGFLNGGLALGLAAAVGASGVRDAWAKPLRELKPAAIVPSSTRSIFTLNFATNAGTFRGTQAQLGTLVRKVYRGPIGPYTKFCDGNKGIRATIANLHASGFSAANGDSRPYICYRRAASDADLEYAFKWLVTRFPNQRSIYATIRNRKTSQSPRRSTSRRPTRNIGSGQQTPLGRNGSNCGRA